MIRQITASQVKEYLSDEQLFDRISEDGCRYEDFNPSSSDLYIGFVDGDVVRGFVWLHSDNATTWWIHANFANSDRAYAMRTATAAISYMFDEGLAEKLIAKVPECFPEVVGFAERVGFVTEGVDRKSIRKGGKLLDRVCLGMTREGFLNGRN